MILVSGATGSIGGEVLRLLLAVRAPVRVLVRDPEKVASLKGKAQVVKADLLQPDTLPAAFAGCEKAFVLVASIQDLPTASGPIFKAAEAAGVKHVVFLSSGTIAMQPATTIGNWHLAAEQQLKATSLQWTMLRPGNFASNSLRWAGTIKSQGTVYAAHAGHRSTVIDPRDIGAVAARALLDPDHAGKTHVLTGPAAITAQEQVDALAAALHKPLKLVEVPEAGARAGMLKSGMGEVLADAILELQRPGRTGGDVLTGTVKALTGHGPRSYADWVKDHLAAFS